MINILFCDDNTEFLSLLHGYVKKIMKSHFRDILMDAELFSYDNGKSVISFAKKSRVDVIFLDIDMKNLNGFEVAKRLIEINDETLIVFVSAYDQFVYDVFEFYPVAFLRKGKICDELPKVLKRISEKLNESSEKLTVCTTQGKVLLREKDIVFIQHSCRDTLSNIEKSIMSLKFYRVHAAYIVNFDQIQSIDKPNSVIMGRNNVPVPIAQRRWTGFKKAYAEYISRSLI